MRKTNKINGCVDAGREGCPCQLGRCGNCLVCGRMSGTGCEECLWTGSCIYTLYRQNDRKIIRGRQPRVLELADIKVYRKDLKVLILKADKGFCQKAQMGGAYVFAGSTDGEQWYDMPVSVLKTEPEHGLLHLAVCGCGPKSYHLLEQNSKILIRGIYYNGLTGLGSLDDTYENTEIFTRGIAIAPLRNLFDEGCGRYRKMLKNLQLHVDLNKIGFDFFCDYFGDFPADNISIEDFECDPLVLQREKLQNSNVIALTSPYYGDWIEGTAGKPVVRPVRGNLCCGEGICGACSFDDEEGNTVRRCKANLR